MHHMAHWTKLESLSKQTGTTQDQNHADAFSMMS